MVDVDNFGLEELHDIDDEFHAKRIDELLMYTVPK